MKQSNTQSGNLDILDRPVFKPRIVSSGSCLWLYLLVYGGIAFVTVLFGLWINMAYGH